MRRRNKPLKYHVRYNRPVNDTDLKDRTLSSLEAAIEKGAVDEEMIPLINAINRIDDLVTTSSCSGRIQLICMPRPGDKLNSNVLGKWHRRIEEGELEEALGKWDKEEMLFLMAQPLLLHIRARDLQAAVRVRNSCQGAGMKFSSIRSLKLSGGSAKDWGTTVEVMGSERMEVPLHPLPDEILSETIGPLVGFANDLIIRTKSHIPVLIDLFSGGL